MEQKKILVINGPNLNLLGTRKPEIYGKLTLKDIETLMNTKASENGISLTFFHSNHEGEIIDSIHSAKNIYDGIIINAGAYSHYSYAIADAIEAVTIDTVELHLSNIYKREAFRAHSVLSGVCIGVISGFSYKSYLMAIEYFI